MHGDVSVGNILLYEDGVKIIDLEYTKQYSEVGEHDGVVCLGCSHCFSSELTLQIALGNPNVYSC